MNKFRLIESFRMKSAVCAAFLALFLLVSASPNLAATRAAGPVAEGSYRFTTADDLTKAIEFSATGNADGSVSGKMTFNGPVEIPEQDVDGEGQKDFSGSLSNLYVEAEFDGLVVENNRAVMSGTVTASNVGEYIGRRVLLVVEDNGDGSDPKSQDAITWGLYKPVDEKWVASDAELKEDPGVGLTWWATDAERTDDKGVPSDKSKAFDCQTFPLSTYLFDEVKYEGGDIRVAA
jgi:hypothetical protein